MVVESILKLDKAIEKPWKVYLIGILYALLAVSFSYWIFKGQVSIIMVAFLTIASIPLIIKAIELEAKNSKDHNLINIFKKYAQINSVLILLFVGFVTVFVVLYLFLNPITKADIFKSQIDTITDIRVNATGNFISSFNSLTSILLNNLKVAGICILFYLVFGMGSMFILSWNASVLGTALGASIQSGVNNNGYLKTVPLNLIGYFLHGIPEIAAYFTASLIGGIISILMINKNLKKEEILGIKLDALRLAMVTLSLLILACLLEVFISPLFLK